MVDQFQNLNFNFMIVRILKDFSIIKIIIYLVVIITLIDLLILFKIKIAKIFKKWICLINFTQYEM